MTGTLLSTLADGIATLTISQPARRNALTTEMVLQLHRSLDEMSSNENVRAIVLTGHGDAFCSGADIHEMRLRQAAGQPFEPMLPGVYEHVLDLKMPIVAAINGDAVGGGLELALACDARIAVVGSRIGLPEVKWGMVPRFGVLSIAAMASRAVALDLALSGKLVDVAKAHRIGLIDQVVERTNLYRASLMQAQALSIGPSVTVAAIKDLLLQRAIPACARDHPRFSSDLAGYDSADWSKGLERSRPAGSAVTDSQEVRGE